MPDYAQPAVKKLVDAGALAGTGTVDGVKQLNLSYDLVRTIVILDRMGAFDKKEAAAAPKTTAAPKVTGAKTGTVKPNIK